MSKVSGTAKTAGLSLEKVSSYIAVISSQTREAPENIGTGVNSILSRYLKVTEAGWNSVITDENGEQVAVNTVDAALQKANISILDANKNFKNFGDILDELHPKWGSLDDVTQKYIATQLAGTRNLNRFLVLMDNYGDSINLYNGAMDSAGTTNQKYAIYLESVAAAQDKMQASLQDLYSTVLDSGALKTWYDDWSGIFEMLNESTKSTDGLNLKLAGLAAAIVLVGAAVKSVRTASATGSFVEGFSKMAKAIFTVQTTAEGATIALSGMQIAMMATGAAIAVTGIVALATAIGNSEQRLEKLRNKVNDLNSKLDDLSDTTKSLEEADASLEKIGEKFHYSTDEISEFNRVRDLVKTSNPDIIDALGLNGESVDNLTVSYKKLKTAVEETITAQENVKWAEAHKGYDSAKSLYDSAVRRQSGTINFMDRQVNPEQEIADYKKRVQGFLDTITSTTGVAGTMSTIDSVIAQLTSKIESFEKTSKDLFDQSVQTGSDASLQEFTDLQTKLHTFRDALRDAKKAQTQYGLMLDFESQWTNTTAKAQEDMKSSLPTIVENAFTDEIATMIPKEYLESIKSAFKQYDFGSMLSDEIVREIQDAIMNSGPEMTDVLSQIPSLLDKIDEEGLNGSMDLLVFGLQSKWIAAVKKAKLDPAKMKSGLEPILSQYNAAVHSFLGSIYGAFDQEYINGGLPSNQFAIDMVNSITEAICTQFKMDTPEVLSGIGDAISNSITFNADRIQSLTQKALQSAMNSSGGNVTLDIDLRPKVKVDETTERTVESFLDQEKESIDDMWGETMTYFSSTYYGKGGSALVVTPILPNGKILSKEQLDTYVEKLLASGNPVKNDSLGLVMGFFDQGTAGKNAADANRMVTSWHKIHEAELEAQDAVNSFVEALKNMDEITLENIIAAAKEAFGSIGKSADESAQELAKVKSDLSNFSSLQSAMSTFSGGGTLDFDSAEKLVKAFPQLTDAWNNGTGSIDDFKAAVYDLYTNELQRLLDTFPDLHDLIVDLSKGSADLATTMQRVTNASTLVQRAITKLNNGLGLDQEDVSALIDQYPELTDNLIRYSRGLESTTDLINDLNKASSNKTAKDNVKTWQETLDSMKKMKKGTEEYNQSLEVLGNTFAAGFGSEDAFTFAESNLKDIQAAANGDVNAFKRLQEAAYVNIVGSSSVDFSQVEKGLVTVQSLAAGTVEALVKSGMFHIETKYLHIMRALDDPTTGDVTLKPMVIEQQILVPDYPNLNGKNYHTGGGGGGGGGGGHKSSSSNTPKVSDLYQKQLDKQEKVLDEIDHREKLAKSWSDYYEARGELKKTIPLMEQEVAILKEKYETTKKNAKSFREQSDTLKGQKDQTESLISQYTANRDKYSKNSKKWKYWDKQIKQLQKLLAQLTADYDAMSDAANDAEESEADLAGQIEDGTQAIKERQDAIRQTKIDVRDAINDYINDIKEQKKAMLSATVDMQNTILDIMKENAQAQADIDKEVLENKKETLNQELTAIRENFEKAKELSEKDSKQAELEKKQNELAAIMMDPTRAKERAQLEQDISGLRSDIAWDAADAKISEQETALQQQIDDIDKQEAEIDKMMDKINEYSTDMIEKMKEVMKMSDSEILAWLQANSKEYAHATAEAQQQMTEGWQDSLDQVNGIIRTNWDEVDKIMSEGMDAVIALLEDTTDFRQAGTLQGQAMVEAFKQQWQAMLDADQTTNDNDDLGAPDNDTDTSTAFKPNGKLEVGDEAKIINSGAGQNIYKGYDKKEKDGKSAIGYALANTDLKVVALSKKGNFARVSGEFFDSKTYEKKQMLGWINKRYLTGYDKGGSVDFTGPAWVDGTPQRPERMLSPNQNALFERMVIALDNMWKAPDLGEANAAAAGFTLQGDLVVQVQKLIDDEDYDEVAEKVKDSLYNKFNVRR